MSLSDHRQEANGDPCAEPMRLACPLLNAPHSKHNLRQVLLPPGVVARRKNGVGAGGPRLSGSTGGLGRLTAGRPVG